jgi:FtsP/CotA-like multicopper oxidase with cupredoxin domain
MKISILGKTNFSSITLALVVALTGQAISNQAHAGAGWGDNVDITGTPIKVQTYYANSPAGMRADPLGGPDIDTGTALRKFVDTLPSVPGLATSTNAGINNLGNYLPPAVPVKWVNMNGDLTNDDYYEIAVVDYTERAHSDLPKATRYRGYVQVATPDVCGAPIPTVYTASPNLPNCPNAVALKYPNGTNITDTSGNQVYGVNKPHYLGPVIIVNRGTAVRIKYYNYLPIGTHPGDSGEMFIPVDRTIPGGGTMADGVTQFPDSRVDIHWHGGDTPWISDGTPHQWITPAGEVRAEDNNIPLPLDLTRGVSAQNVPDMPDPGPGAGTLYFPNNMSGRLMFYHDHTSAITRINVYVGMAAGYLINDPVEQKLMTDGVVPSEQIPLVIQDKTFVPKDIALQDAKWDTTHWGQPGDLWFPHVYETNQDPNSIDGTNPVGRWDWGPWFWPVFPAQYSLPTGTYGDVTTTPEAFMDTPVINGTAYPTLTVDPKAYRFRILNAANDRFVTLSLFTAMDANGVLCDQDNPNPAPEASGVACTEVPMVPAIAQTAAGTADVAAASAYINDPRAATARHWPSNIDLWPVDGRIGGIPDPVAIGPNFIHIGSEGGIVPKPAIIPAQPIAYETNRRSITVLNILYSGLMMGPAERADVVVDFSDYAGSTLLLYNDSPAPVPAFDPRIDYYTGDGDQTGSGGWYDTLPGYGPNTRTMMQIKVRSARSDGAPIATYDLAKLETELPKAYGLSQEPPIIPQSIYNQAFGTADNDNLFHIFNGTINQPNFEWTPTQPGQAVLSININGGGTGYKFAPVVNFTGGGIDLSPAGIAAGNHHAIALAKVDPVTQMVIDIQLIDPGQGYTSAPQITFTPVKGGVGASASVRMTGTMSLPIKTKAIQELFEPVYGRMNATLGVELPFTSALIQTTIPLNYIDPATEIIADGETQIWKITHNGVDTHPVHFHLVNVQIINRVGWDGTVKAPRDYEFGWKETVVMNPLEDIIVAVRAKHPLVPFGQPQSKRLMDPSEPEGSTLGFTQIDPYTNNPLTVSNAVVNFDNEYVWHCHILGHEENDFMRPFVFHPSVIAPSAITDLAVGTKLTWTDPTPALAATTLGNMQNEIGYKIMRSVNGGAFVQVGTARANATSWDGSLENPPVSVAAPAGSNYIYRVDIYNVAGTNPSNEATLATAPGAASGLTATVLSATSVKLDWTPSQNSAGQQLWRCAGAGCTTFAQVGADMSATVATVTDSGLTSGATYVYMVRALASAGSGFTDADSATLQVTAGAPTAPTAVGAASVAGGLDPQATVSWTDTANNEASFAVGRKIAAAGTCTTGGYTTLNSALPASVPVSAGGALSFADTTAAFGATYCYQVTATNAAGSASAITANAVTMVNGVAAPKNLVATADATANNVTLTWTDNSTNETGFQVRASTDGGTSWTTLSTTIAASAGTGTAKTFSHTTATAALPLAPNNSYTYEVTAFNGGVSSLAVTAVASTTVVTPATPAALGATVTSATTMDLSWMDMATSEDDYLVEVVGTPAIPAITSSASQKTQINRAMSYNVGSLVSGTTYTIRVTARSTQFGLTANASAEINVTAGSPAAPTNSLPGFTTNAAGSQVDLVWQDNANNETSYRVERATYDPVSGLPGAYTTLANIARSAAEKAAAGALSVVSYSDTTTAALTKYSYRITAVNYADSTSLLVDADLALPLAPLTPSNVVASVLSATQVDLSWTDNAIDETGYRVEVSINNGAFVTLALLNGTVDQSLNVGTRHYSPDYSATHINAAAGNSYVYRVTAFRTQFGYTNYSAGATSALVDIVTPVAPKAVSATPGVGGANVVLIWQDNAANETDYQVEVAVNGGATYTLLDTLPAGSNAYNAVGTATGNTYTYRVTARNVNGGAIVTSAPAIFMVDMTAPAAPTGLGASANAGGTQVTLSWTDVATNETHYRIERAPVTGGVVGAYGTADEIVHALSNGAVSYVDPVATVPGSAYSYRVTALNKTGAVTMASTSVITVADLTPPAAPADPTGLTYSVVSGTSVDLSWTDVATTETGYSVEVETDGVGGFVALTPDLAADSTSYTGTVAVGHTYRFKVRALTTHLGSTTYSNYSNIASLNMAVPAVPSSLSAAPAVDGTSVGLSWADNANNETGYLVEVSTNDGATYSTLTTVARNATQSANVNVAPVTYTHSPTVPNTKYTYRVSAVNEVATTTTPLQIFSAPITVVADLSAAPAPNAPTLLGANVVSTTSVQLSWTDNTVSAPDQAGVNGYIVEVETDGVGGFVAQPSLAAHSTTATVAALVGHTYRYQVRAYNTNLGSTVYSTYVGPVSVNMANPVAPVAVSATPNVDGTQVLVAWTDMANNETEYLIATSINGVYQPALDATVARTVLQGSATGGAVYYTAKTTPAPGVANSPNVYTYVVTAINQAGATVSIPSTTTITLTADLSAPAAPLAPATLGATVSGTNVAPAVDLSWAASANATSYVVQRSINGGAYTNIATVTTGTTYQDTNVTPSASAAYSYQVISATTALGSTVNSAAASPVASINVSIPAQPVVTATPASNGTSVHVTWAAVTNATGYEVSVDGGAATTQTALFIDQTTTPGSGVHNYSVVAVNQAGTTVKLSSTSGTSGADLTPPAAPAAPATLMASVSGTAIAPEVDLSWAAAANATGYVVQRDSGAGFADYATVPAGTTYADTAPAAATNSYQVVAYTTTLGVTVRSLTASPVKSVNLSVPAQPVVNATASVNGSLVQVHVSWAADANATGYEVTVDGVTSTQTALFVDPAFALGSGVHNYSVVAVNQAGTTVKLSSPAGAASTDMTVPAVPAAPLTLTATVNGTLLAQTVDLSWAAVANATGYLVQRSDNGGAYTTIATVAAGTTHVDATVASASLATYSYQVQTYTTNLGVTVNSATMSPVAAINLSIPAQPVVTATPAIDGTSVHVSWAAVANSTGYEVSIDGAPATTQTALFVDQVTVAGSGIHNYSVTAVNQAGATVKFSSTAGTATADLTPPGAPAAPTALSHTVISSTAVRLTWVDNATTETGYVVADSVNGTSVTLPAGTTSYDAPVAVENAYSFTVHAFTTVLGTTTPSVDSNVIVVNLVTPAAPTIQSAVPAVDGSSVALTWLDNASNETSYTVEIDSGAGYGLPVTLPAGTTTYTAAVTKGVINTYRVTAVNTDGAVTRSAASSITADLSPAPAPTMPGSFAVNVTSNTQVDLTWTDVANETSYTVYKQVDGAGFVALPALPANSTGYADTAVTVGHTYSYQVIASTLLFGTTTDSGVAGPLTVDLTLPGAPAGLVAVPATDGTLVALTWVDTATNEVGYTVEIDSGAGFGAPISLAANSTTYQHAGTVAGGVYTYRVTAVRVAGGATITASANVVANINPTVPVEVSGVAAYVTSSTSLKVYWNDNSTNETGFRIQGSIDGGASFTDLANWPRTAAGTTATGTLNFAVTVTPGSTYIIRVQAYQTMYGLTAYTAGQDSPSVNLPSVLAPTNLVATPNKAGTQVTLSWVDKATNETGYLVEVSTDNGVTFTPATVSPLAAGTTSYVATTTPGSIYTYRVSAVLALPLTTVYSTTVSVVADLTPPAASAAPTGVAAILASPTTAKVYWVDNATDETGYRIESSSDGGVTWTVAFDWFRSPAQSLATGSQNWTVSVTTGNKYLYRVSSFKTQYGFTTYSASTVSGVVDVTLPAAPSGLGAVLGSNGQFVNLSWVDNASNETGYLIEVSLDNGVTYSAVTTLVANSVSYTATTIPGNKYTYRVTAVNGAGSSNSATVVADLSVPPTAPVAPSGTFAILPTATTAKIYWADNSINESGFRIEASTDGGVTFSLIADWVVNAAVSANSGVSLNYTTNVVQGSTYIFRVSSFKTNLGLTSYSAPAVSASVVVP